MSQGTTDIASQSVEAPGRTFSHITDDPTPGRRYTVSTTVSEHDAKRIALCINSGLLFGE
ncbi:MAG: hypothetical protein OXH01_03785 [Bacteroidetes bacterium]|nr:hypothetical protein [Bacteroidota bacterium]